MHLSLLYAGLMLYVNFHVYARMYILIRSLLSFETVNVRRLGQYFVA